jgi:hypothetical protein
MFQRWTLISLRKVGIDGAPAVQCSWLCEARFFAAVYRR